jgi:hypothetical protein
MFLTRWTRARRRRTLLGVGVGVLLLLGHAQPAHADPYARFYFLPDDLIEDYCFSGSNWGSDPFAVDLVNLAMANLDAQTDLTARSRSCSSSTDIRFVLGTTWESSTWCPVQSQRNSYCDQNVAYVNMPQALSRGKAGAREVNALRVVCELVGNAVGLKGDYATSGGEDCMTRRTIEAWEMPTMTSYNDHHVAHVNSRAVSYS